MRPTWWPWAANYDRVTPTSIIAYSNLHTFKPSEIIGVDLNIIVTAGRVIVDANQKIISVGHVSGDEACVSSGCVVS